MNVDELLKILRRLTTDEAFGYAVLFSLVGMVIGGILILALYKILLSSGKLSLFVLESTHESSIKIKLYMTSVIITVLLCFVIAGIVVAVDCGNTECAGVTVGRSAAFIVPGTLLQILTVCIVVYMFVRCCSRDKSGVKRMEDDTAGHYHKNQVYKQSENFVSSNDLKTRTFETSGQNARRTFSEKSDDSLNLHSDRGFVDKSSKTHTELPMSSHKVRDNSESEVSIDLKSDRSSINVLKKGEHRKLDPLTSKPLKETGSIGLNRKPGDSGYNSKNPGSISSVENKDPVLLSGNNINIIAPANQPSDKQEVYSNSSSSSSDKSIKDGGLSPEIYRTDRTRSGSRPEVMRNTSTPATTGHVTNYQSSEQSKVMVIPDEHLSCIISVPTGEGSSESSSEDNEAVQKDGEKSNGKKTTKKRSKKKKWRKKKQPFVSPEQTDNTEKIKMPRKKKTIKKKKSKIII
ncbi:unnamed protein product [Mytilus coruscus]|uniref:Uncharacterized protein n=1 Tax=Mytilus coruscus TaxID=42192 RepID=A0A6J8BVR6_MYTCO|nr:unnamed protein product [Mytilus coruscus]